MHVDPESTIQPSVSPVLTCVTPDYQETDDVDFASNNFHRITRSRQSQKVTIDDDFSIESIADGNSVMLEKWEGFVLRFGRKAFTAEMRVNRLDQLALMVDFSIDELPPDDIQILAEGMHVVWTLTRENRRGGARKICSEVYLLRHPSGSLSSRERELTNKLDEWFSSHGHTAG